MKGLFLTILCALASAVQAKDNSMFFIENVGQYIDQYNVKRSDIDFGLRRNGIQVFINAGAIHYQFMKAETQTNSYVNFKPVFWKRSWQSWLN